MSAENFPPVGDVDDESLADIFSLLSYPSKFSPPKWKENLPSVGDVDDVPIPTIEEIETKGHRHQHPSGTPNITIYKNKYLIKKSQEGLHDRLLREIENMEYVRRHTTIPIPKVLAVLKADDGITTYLVMNYIHAPTVQQAWSTLSDAEKEEVALQLGKHLRQLHSLRPASPAMLSGCNGGPLPVDLYCLPLGGRFLKREKSEGYDLDTWEVSCNYRAYGKSVVHHEYNGPFYNESDWVTALWARCFAWNPKNHHAFKKMTEPVFRDHAAQFCHGDIQLKNILLERIPVEERENEFDSQFKVTLIDWEAAGFYPEFWDFCISTFCGWRSGWVHYVERAMKPYWIEYPVFRMALNCDCRTRPVEDMEEKRRLIRIKADKRRAEVAEIKKRKDRGIQKVLN